MGKRGVRKRVAGCSRLRQSGGMKGTMAFRLLYGLLLLGLAGRAQGEPVAAPEESVWAYEFVAKLSVRSVDRGTDVVFFRNGDWELHAFPLHAEVLETVRETGLVDRAKLLVRARYDDLRQGESIADFDLERGRYAPSNVVAVACNPVSDPAGWCVIEWLLDEELWETYRRQVETGIVEKAGEREMMELKEAIRQRAALWERVKTGEISREEYLRLSAPYTEIIEHLTEEMSELF